MAFNPPIQKELSNCIKMKYYCDGFLLGNLNPSKKGGGYTITDESGNIIHREVIKKENFTNNEAEIAGILKVLEIAKKGDIVSTDSMCCLSWVNAGKSKARKDLYEVFQKCRKLKEEKKINLMFEGREFNKAGWINENNHPNYDGIFNDLIEMERKGVGEDYH